MPRLAISNIAWTNEEESAVAEKLQQLGVAAVEIAPTKRWDDPTKATEAEITEYQKWWKSYGIDIVAFQSMLFARPDLKLFESSENRAECLRYLQDFIVLAGRMGAKRMVFGSPKNRQRGLVSYQTAFAIAKDFFTEIAKTAEENDVIFCLEPNAPQYNCDFIITAKEGAELVRAVDRPGFGLHLDTACMTLAGDDVTTSIWEAADVLQHFHISSPMLDQVEERSDVDHNAAAAALKGIMYEGTISIEMRPGAPAANTQRVDHAVVYAKNTYHL